MTEKTAQKEPGKKPAPSKKPKPQQEVVVQISLSELHPFPDHPFQVREDASMQETAESVKEYGVLVPALARPREDGGYELIAGHRRKHACELAGLATMPVIVRDIDRDAATIIMVDSNLQRENILPSERAKAYKMKMEAIKRQGARTDLTSPKISAKFRSDDEVGQDAGVSGDTIRNYIALTQLVPELQQMVDEKKIALSPAYQLAALTPKEQGLLLISMCYTQLFNLLCEKADDVYGGRLPVHVRCLIDEAANIGQIPRLEKLVATIRSREISCCLVLQAQSQLKALYKDSTDTIIGNMDCSIFLGGKEPGTLKELAAALGKETIDSYNTGESRGREVSHSLNYQKLGKELMSVDELAVLDGGKCILQLRGVRPFLSNKYDLTKHPLYRYTADYDKKYAFDIERFLSHRLKLKPDDAVEVYQADLSGEPVA